MTLANRLVAIAVLVAPALSAQAAPQPATAAPEQVQDDHLLLHAADITGAHALSRDLHVGDFTLQRLQLPDTAPLPFAVEVELQGQVRRLELYPHSLRGPEFQLLVQDDLGLHAVEAAAPTTYRGTVAGLPDSIVAASLTGGQLTGFVRLMPELPVLGIQPASALDPSFDRRDHLVYDARDNLPHDGVCGTPDDDSDVPTETAGPGDGGPVVTKICQVACDTDWEYYLDKGSSVSNTQNDIEAILNAVEAIYEADVAIIYEITTIIVRSTSADPYSTSSPSGLLNQFEDEWNDNHDATTRDVAHMFTGRNLSGSTIGIASLNTICALGSAYGLSENYTSNFTNLVALTAHELGHNWSSPHCNGTTTCRIMCSSLGGCGSVTSFGGLAISALESKKNSAACLEAVPPDMPPILNSMSAAQIPALNSAQVTLSGSNLIQVSQVIHDGVVLNEGQFVITSNWSIAYAPPAATSIGMTSVSVVNAAGVSAEVAFEYTANDPPQIEADFVAFSGGPMEWRWSATPGSSALLLFALDPTTFEFDGQDILLHLSILHSAIIPAGGIDSFEINLPASASGVLLFTQIATLDPNFAGASNILTTFIL